MSAAEWVFRHAGGCLIDTPDFDLPEACCSGAPWRWIATLWPDKYRPDGWAVLEWAPAERGWWMPATPA